MARYSNLSAATPTASDILEDANANLSKFFSGLLKTSAAVLPLSATDKQKLVKTPLNYLLKLFSPIQNVNVQIIDRVTRRTGKTRRKVNAFSSQTIDMRTVQPADAQYKKNNPDLWEFYFAIRVMCQFMAIVLTALPVYTDEAARLATGQPIGKPWFGAEWDLGAARANGAHSSLDGLGDVAATPVAVGVTTVAGPPLLDLLLKTLIDLVPSLVVTATQVTTSIIVEATKPKPEVQQPVATDRLTVQAPVPSSNVVVARAASSLVPGVPDTALAVGGVALLGVLVVLVRSKK